MRFIAVPVIRNSKVEELSIRFNRPISMQNLKILIQRISNEVDPPRVEDTHVHSFVSFPVYHNGEMIAKIDKCSCGKSIRQTL